MSIDPHYIRFSFPTIQKNLNLHLIDGQTMGTCYGVQFYAPGGIDKAAIKTALQKAVDDVDGQMSPWIETSDLMRINNAPVGKWTKISPQTLDVIEQGLKIEGLSFGAFNIALGHAVNAWGFGKDDIIEVPQAPMDLAAKTASSDLLSVDKPNLRIMKNAPATLDLCGIAKGYGVDQLAKTLERFEIEDYFVGIDGEVRMAGEKPDGSAWRVAIENPDPTIRKALLILDISDISLATSGDYRHFKQHNGCTISHTMDATTGKPIENSLTSVTVACKECMDADAWATALLAMGKDKALECAKDNALDALLIERIDGQLAIHKTGEFTAIPT